MCGAGLVEVQACSALQDTVCEDSGDGGEECPAGQFLHGGTGQCEACPACPEGSYLSTSCTASVAGVCSQCSACGEGFVESEACSAMADTVCEAGGDTGEDCAFGEFVDPATSQCTACTACADGHYMSVSCSAFVAGVCSQCTVCDGGQTEMEACTAVADTVCDAGVVECPTGQFLHGGTGQCEACPACPEGSYFEHVVYGECGWCVQSVQCVWGRLCRVGSMFGNG